MPALNLHGLPGWLYGIDETRLNEQAREAVIRFQREATDVLYRHFSQRQPALAQPSTLVPSEPIAQPEAPAIGAPPVEWIRYHQQMIAFLEWQQEVEQWRGNVESRLESVEEITRLVPELIERLGPQTISPEHQRTIQSLAKRLHEARHVAYSTIYAELGEHFHVARYTDIPEAQWQAVMSWFQIRLR